jgi:hypothetical protein
MCFGQRFTWVTDCYAIKFILSYDGCNPSILRLQMRLMCWDMDIEHRNDTFLTDADYWSCLGVDLCFDPLLKNYIDQVNSFRERRPSPTALPPLPENMPNFHGPRLLKAVANAPNLISEEPLVVPPTVLPLDSCQPAGPDAAPAVGFQHCSNYAVQFGWCAVPRGQDATRAKVLYNSHITAATSILSKFDWAVYGFNNGHFHSTFSKRGMPFDVVLACNPYANGRALFTKICACPTILSSAPALLDHIRSSGNTAPLTGYLIHSHQYTSTKPTHKFWEIQAHIAIQLHAIRSLLLVVAIVHPKHDCQAVVVNFTQRLRSSGWVVTDTHIHFPHFGNLLSGTCRLILAVHSNTEEKCKPIKLLTPPQLSPRLIGRYLWAPFNRAEHAVSYSKDNKSFNNHAVNDNGMPPLRASTPSDAQLASYPDGMRVKYYLHRHDDNPANLVGAAVVSTDGHCSPFNPVANTNIFGHYFGIEYICDGSTYVRAISPFKFVSCF